MGRQSPLLGMHHNFHPAIHRKPPSRTSRITDILLFLGTIWALFVTLWLFNHYRPQLRSNKAYLTDPVLISYAYYEKDAIQVSNFEYFLAVGTRYPALHTNMHWVFTIAGDKCSPCTSLEALLGPPIESALPELGIREVRGDAKISLIRRMENAGMDLGSHNVTLEYMRQRGALGRYSYYIFLNSSVKGPFWPSYLPHTWHWTQAYLQKMQPHTRTTTSSSSSSSLNGGGLPPRPIAAVGSSLVCLPKVDAGGPGPRLESWAIALNQEGLAAAVAGGAFIMRGCKLCPKRDLGIVVGGEYGLTHALFRAGYNIATLMSRYADDIDWTDPTHWSCNDNIHPSRHGTYQGISQHPYETIFVKASWHVAEPYTRRYGQWAVEHLLGKPGTSGTFNEGMYRFAISAAAQHPKDLEQAYAAAIVT